MLNQKHTQTQIAVRLYDNKTYGTTYGKGKFRRAIYNGSIEVEKASYLVDFYNYDDWVNTATSDVQMAYLSEVDADSNTLYSWIKHYDRTTKEKTLIEGLCAIREDLVVVIITDTARGIIDGWELQPKPCRDGKRGAPQILATNADLNSW